MHSGFVFAKHVFTRASGAFGALAFYLIETYASGYVSASVIYGMFDFAELLCCVLNGEGTFINVHLDARQDRGQAGPFELWHFA